MGKIAEEVEAKKSSFIDTPYTQENKVTAYLAKSAVKAALRLNTKAIVADSVTGTSILALSAYRGDNPIYAQVYDKRVMRQLSLSFGVHADYLQREITSVLPLRKAICRLIEDKRFKPDDLIIILAGHFGAKQGASFIEISTAGNLMKQCG
jgi:pyruvate kinase